MSGSTRRTVRKADTLDRKYVVQVTVEKGFDTKLEAERWAMVQDTRHTLEAEVDAISTSIWEPS
jgi:hypothetical protein